MKEQIDLTGASGEVYRYRLAAEATGLPRMAGNFVFVRNEVGGPTVVFVGENNDLTGAHARWDEARAGFGATHVYTRLNISRAIRAHELDDLVGRYAPAMNAESRQNAA